MKIITRRIFRVIIYLGSIFICNPNLNAQNAPFPFTKKGLLNYNHGVPTSLQFGPDGKLYVAHQGGQIRIVTVEKSGDNYEAKNVETLELVRSIPNHDDNGVYNPNVNARLVTGILVKGTSDNPILYVSSSDPRMGAGLQGDVDLCTNSGVISKLYKENGTWKKIDLVRGLPRSEENHAVQGMQIDDNNNRMLLAVGGLTNAGGVSRGFAYITEYALSACILSIDLAAIEAMPTQDAGGSHPYKYNMPTLDDPTRNNNPDGSDVNDPWGGNDGLNQSKIVPGGPVQLYATGFRNAYDLVITSKRRLYAVDNGANAGWGGYPDKDNEGRALNNYNSNEPGSSYPNPPGGPWVNNKDGFHHIGNIDNYTPGSYYGGHPCPTRGNPNGAGLYTHTWSTQTGIWRTSKEGANPLPADWPPVPNANPVENNFKNPGTNESPALLTFNTSTNGICEYKSSAFNDAMRGNLVVATFDGRVYVVRLNEDGTQVLNSLKPNTTIKENGDGPIAQEDGTKPLDVTTQGDDAVFPGTIWVANYAGGNDRIWILEPQDNLVCTGLYNDNDDDFDCYSNADEEDNNTNPCSAASRPPDFNNNCISDLRDTDDDSDGILDVEDAFARDSHNGDTTQLPVLLPMYNGNPGTGFFGLGFTGMMKDNTTDYLNMYDTENLIAGGAAGKLTVQNVPAGDAYGNMNSQQYAFQLGVNVNSNSGIFTARTVMAGPFFNGQTPTGEQSQGFYIGTGDQDNYLKIVLNAHGGSGGVAVVHENNGQVEEWQYDIPEIPTSNFVLYLTIDSDAGTVIPGYSYTGEEITYVGDPISLTGNLLSTLQGPQAIAVGVIATSRDGVTFSATWDDMDIYSGVGPTSIKNFGENTQTIYAYPNPVNNNLNIKYSSKDGKAITLRMYSAYGAYLRDITIEPGETVLNMSSFTPGIYILKYTDLVSNQMIDLKVVKQ